MQRPLVLPDRSGADLRTSLRGAFGKALMSLGCKNAAKGQSCFGLNTRHACQMPDHCALPWLFEPHVAIQRRDHPSPVVLTLTGIDDQPGDTDEPAVSAMEIRLVLFGRHANQERELVLAALSSAGQRGLLEPGPTQGSPARKPSSVSFEVQTNELWSGTLCDWVAGRFDGQVSSQLDIHLATPLCTDPPDFGPMLGNLAHDLVQWDLADSGLAAEFVAQGHGDAKRWCDDFADCARAHVKKRLTKVRVNGDVSKMSLGRRRSRSNGNSFELHGFTGWLTLTGEFQPILPWLVALELRGGGKKKSFGLGEVRLEAL